MIKTKKARASLVAWTVKNLPAMQETRFDSWVGKISPRRERQLTPVFLPGEFHGQRSLVGYSPWGHKESDMTEQLNVHFLREERGKVCFFNKNVKLPEFTRQMFFR